jgi:histidinol-phosphate aminotransferase
VTFDLQHHGDAEVAPGLVDLAVNVRRQPMPAWLSEPIAASLTQLAAYPDATAATAAVAARHRRDPAEVLLTAGAAQGFVLLAQTFRGARRPVVVHPQFTEPEAALVNAGHAVGRVLLREADGFRLDPALVPDDSDLVVLGNPTNPTSVLHPAAAITALARPGRILVVDEAFADTTRAEAGTTQGEAGPTQGEAGPTQGEAGPTQGEAGPTHGEAGPTRGVPDDDREPESLAERRDVPGLVVVRSLTKTWGLAGLRIGYLLGHPDVLDRLRRVQPLWPVSTPALAAATACASPTAVRAEREIARELAGHRAHLAEALTTVPGITIAGHPRSAFLSFRLTGADKVRLELRERGFAVRRGDTFPGLGPDWLRIAVRDTATTDAFVATLIDVLKERL